MREGSLQQVRRPVTRAMVRRTRGVQAAAGEEMVEDLEGAESEESGRREEKRDDPRQALAVGEFQPLRLLLSHHRLVCSPFGPGS